MADLDLPEMRAAGNLDALYWWRRSESREAQPAAESLTQRIVALAERATKEWVVAESPQTIELPGNRLRANADAQCIADRAALQRDERAADLRAQSRHERRSATNAVAAGVVVAAASAAMLDAAAAHDHVALTLALVGTFAAFFALWRALRRRLPIRSGDTRKILASSFAGRAPGSNGTSDRTRRAAKGAERVIST